MSAKLLEAIRVNLNTQDNRITSYPIFVVQQKVRDFGILQGYGEDGYLWVSEHGGEEASEEDRVLCEEDDDWAEEHGFEKRFFRNRWEFVQPFFTEKGALDYLRINGHNLHETRIYVESGWRNEEWQAVRAFLKGGYND